MIPEVGQRLGPYEILGKLGSGGMGLVFRAWDERLHREVAVKLLHDEYRMPQMRERFLQEARAASGLNHPNICTVFDIGEQDGYPYLVMELLEGETLKDRIERGAIPVEEIVRYSEEIATALAVAHAKGIVHRDVKPANIFLVRMPNGKSQAKVLDFGLAMIGLEVRGGGSRGRSI
jgi:eukaryotic-like serine/threonine-protein kinase